MKPGRNDPCPCGSGKKYKHCCEGKASPRPAEASAPVAAGFDPLIALYNAGRYAELESQARLLIEQFPAAAFAWKLLSGALLRQGKEALPAFQKTAELMPDDAEAHYNLGVVLKNLGRLNEAVDCYRRAITIKPDYAEAHSNLGNVLKECGQLDEAVVSYQRALSIWPDSAEAHNSLGTALKERGQLDEAVVSYRRAIKIKPQYAEAWINLGTVQQHLGQLAEAVASFRTTVQLKPNFAEGHFNLGNTLKYLGHFNKAAESFRRALEIKPDFAEVYSNLGIVLKDLGEIDGALSSYRRALELKPDFFDAYSNLLFTLSYSSGYTPADCLAEARQYGQTVSAKVTSRFTAWHCDVEPKRLRVGMVSGDLRDHSVGHFLESLLGRIDPAQIELYAYPTHPKEDALTARIKPYFAAWKPLAGLNGPAAAQLIHTDGVHILIDLSGHTAHNRLPVFAWKPAPVQFTWIGFPATTGLAEMDYILGDPVAIPVADEGHFSEQVWRLPESYLCLTPPDVALEVSPLPALASGCVTFASFNNLTKISDATVAVWVKVLQAVPGSRLLLKSKQLQDASELAAAVQRFATHGIARDRLMLEGWAPQRIDHLAAYQRVDIALDTFPYRGVTTSGEALWMGVPVITLRGDRFLSRTAESIARNAGLADWIAADEEDYVVKAVFHATHLVQLAALRASLRQQVLASPLFDAPRFARHFEAALWGMWRA